MQQIIVLVKNKYFVLRRKIKMINNTKGYSAVSVLERAAYAKDTYAERVMKNHSVFELSVYGRGSNNTRNIWEKVKNKARMH